MLNRIIQLETMLNRLNADFYGKPTKVVEQPVDEISDIFGQDISESTKKRYKNELDNVFKVIGDRKNFNNSLDVLKDYIESGKSLNHKKNRGYAVLKYAEYIDSPLVPRFNFIKMDNNKKLFESIDDGLSLSNKTKEEFKDTNENIRKFLEGLEASKINRSILLYMLLPPRRCDNRDLKVCHTLNELNSTSGNRYYVPSRTLIYEDHKNTKTTGTQNLKIDDLNFLPNFDLIQSSLHLLEKQHPPVSQTTFSRLVKKETGFTINDLRHYYLEYSSKNFNRNQLGKITEFMGTSLKNMLDTYIE